MTAAIITATVAAEEELNRQNSSEREIAELRPAVRSLAFFFAACGVHFAGASTTSNP